MTDLDKMIVPLKSIVRSAGEAILEVYHAQDELQIDIKSDDSPVTKADRAAHDVIVAGLAESLPGYPILSEEGGIPEFEERRSWSRYWLVDPLDGTKEFINHNDEFTVNIALIENGAPVLGIVSVPVKGEIYYGGTGLGAWKESASGTVPLKVSPLDTAKRLQVVGSRRHGAEALQAMLQQLENRFAGIDLVSMGSSLKICALAEGLADWYPRLALTSEWDTAAAHAVLNAAGGEIFDENLQILQYNQKDSLLNPFFHAVADSNFNWKAVVASATAK